MKTLYDAGDCKRYERNDDETSLLVVRLTLNCLIGSLHG